MDAAQSLAIMKALADQSRLAIVSSLLDRPHYAEDLAKRHALAPSTISFHLKKLEQAGLISSRREQYYVVVQANEPLFATTLKELVSICATGKALQDERSGAHRAKVITTFFPHGVLEKMPAQRKKRLIVLEQFAHRFETGHHYTETEVTALIRPLYDDYCTVRRLLVDEGMIRRDDGGYWREASESGPESLPLPGTRQTGNNDAGKTEKRRTELKRAYKESRPAMGIYQIRNRVNGKLFIDSSKNLAGSITSREFQLRMGKIPSSPSLQKELVAYGMDAFEVTTLEELSPPQPGERPERLLMAAKLRWQEKLQPFDERGYNSRKGFEREKNSL